MDQQPERQVDAAVEVIELELLKLVRYLETFARRYGAEGNLDRAGYVLLRTLEPEGDATVNSLAERLHLDASTVTRQVTALQAAGFVRRHPDPADRRSATIVRTRSGQKAMEQAAAARCQLLGGVLAGWSTAERERFGGGLRKFNAALEGAVTRHPGSARLSGPPAGR